MKCINNGTINQRQSLRSPDPPSSLSDLSSADGPISRSGTNSRVFGWSQVVFFMESWCFCSIFLRQTQYGHALQIPREIHQRASLLAYAIWATLPLIDRKQRTRRGTNDKFLETEMFTAERSQKNGVFGQALITLKLVYRRPKIQVGMLSARRICRW